MFPVFSNKTLPSIARCRDFLRFSDFITISSLFLLRGITATLIGARCGFIDKTVLFLPSSSISSLYASFKIAKKALQDFVTEVEPVSNQVVIKTTTAAAQVIAESIDNLYLEGIVASLAGDNVVLIITADQKNAKLVAKSIEDYIE